MQNYIYDASGERVLKANTSTTTVYQNGTLVSPSTTTINGYTTYPSGFIVVDPLGNYTKHYYAGSQRIVSRFVGSASIFTNNSAARTSESPTLDDKKLQKEQKADLQRFLEKASIGKPIYKDFKPYSYEEVNKLLAENEKDKTESDTNVSSAAPEPPVTINTVYYYHPDHLGTSTFLTDYYGAKYQFFLNLPFGETMAEQLPSTYYKTPYKFNGKELDEETGLYYYGARYYDPRISIWLSVDPLAEQTPHVSPYAFCLNNPIRYNDPTGMSAEDPLDYYNNSGDRVGTDGVNDGRKAVVTDNSEARAIKRTDRDGGTTALSTVSSAVVLPSDAVLQESLNVLDRAVQNGGQREESSLVLNNGSVLRGQTGPEPTVTNGVQTAPSTLPALPAGTTTADVEATIHSHPITVPQVGNQVFPQSASVPSTGPGSDGPTFAQYNTNIIVGPLGTVTNVTQNPNGTLNIPNRPNGAAIYNRDSTPRVELKQRTIEKILSPRQ
jgi:RHS repeat-associated protein